MTRIIQPALQAARVSECWRRRIFFAPLEDVLENFAQIVEPVEKNLLINPPRDFSRIKLVIEKNPFDFDPDCLPDAENRPWQ